MPRSTTAPRQPQQRQASGAQQQTGAIQAYEERSKHPIVTAIQDAMPSIAPMLPRSMPADRFQAMVLQAVVANPEVLACTFPSIIRAVMQAAQEGIPLTGAAGGAYLVPFAPERGAQPEATLMRDYRALIRMAIRSGGATKIEARAVREGDEFSYELGDTPRVIHRPKVGNDAPAHTWYAIAWLPNGDTVPEVMTRKQVEHIRSKSRMANSGPWRNDFDQMGRKTVIRRLVNYLDMTPEQRALLDREERIEFGDDAMAPVMRLAPTAQRGELHERAAQRANLLAGPSEQATEQPATEQPATEPDPQPEAASSDATGTASDEKGSPPPADSTSEPEAALSLEEATMAVYSAAATHGITKGMDANAAWARIDELAREAIPDTDPETLTVADWQAIRQRLEAGEWDPAVARPTAS